MTGRKAVKSMNAVKLQISSIYTVRPSSLEPSSHIGRQPPPVACAPALQPPGRLVRAMGVRTSTGRAVPAPRATHTHTPRIYAECCGEQSTGGHHEHQCREECHRLVFPGLEPRIVDRVHRDGCDTVGGLRLDAPVVALVPREDRATNHAAWASEYPSSSHHCSLQRTVTWPCNRLLKYHFENSNNCSPHCTAYTVTHASLLHYSTPS